MEREQQARDEFLAEVNFAADELKALPLAEVVAKARNVLADRRYRPSYFTPTIHGIIGWYKDNLSLSERQAEVLRRHIAFFEVEISHDE